MLAYILALVVGLGSLAIYLAAFFFPEIHRKNDFIWSGIGLFYALALWIFAPGISGGLLLGHLASVALLLWFGWQTLSLRYQLTPESQQTPIPSAELIKVSIQGQLSKFSPQKSFQILPRLRGNIVNNVWNPAKNWLSQIFSRKPVVIPPPIKENPLSEILDQVVNNQDVVVKEAEQILPPLPLLPEINQEVKLDVVVTSSSEIAAEENPESQQINN
jgi:hypothetical protein